jgi:8-oxo-dGTP pyrophosphatase MutT (NUDIX family)
VTEPDLADGATRLWRCSEVDIQIEPAPPTPDRPDVEARWRDMCAHNDRLYDGPMLSVASFDPPRHRVVAHLDSYKRFAVQPHVSTGAILLATTGAITACDRHGRDCALLIRRDAQTRAYAGLWEIAPAGGIDPPTDRRTHLTFDDVAAQIRIELREEAGLDIALRSAAIACVYHDDNAQSLDVVVRASLDEPVERLLTLATDTHWDAAETAWIPLDDLDAFVSDHPCIPPTRVVMQALGWLHA